ASRCSPSVVEPTTSQNRTVASSRRAGAGDSIRPTIRAGAAGRTRGRRSDTPRVQRPAPAGTRRVVLVSLVVAIVQAIALAAAALVTDSSAIVAQTFATAADVAVQVFLVIGVYTSVQDADETHPLGYGRERYFWSLYAALAIFVSGIVVAFE